MRLRGMGESISACSANRETRIFCEEGFWFRDAFLQWATAQDQEFLWPIPFPRDPIQAVSIGMALSFRFSEIPDSFRGLGHFSELIFDGWGFMTGIRVDNKLLRPCPPGKFQIYCEFGRGRASFFTGRIPETPSEKDGKAFALGMHGLPVPPRMGRFARILTGKEYNAETNLKNCLSLRHILDCADTLL